MGMTYIQAISAGFPGTVCYSSGDGSVYSTLVWVSGPPLPTQAVLDAYIATYNATKQPVAVASSIQISPNFGNVLQVFNGNAWSTSITSLENLTDVTVSNLTAGQTLQYTGTTWTNTNLIVNWNSISGIPGNVTTVSTAAVANLGNAPGLQTGASTSIPLAGNIGRIFVATDSGVVSVDNGATWVSQRFPVVQLAISSIPSKSSTNKVNLGTSAPKSTTGTLLWTGSFTPHYANSLITLSGAVYATADAYGSYVSIGAFSNATCIGVATNFVSGGAGMLGYSFTDTPNTTSNVTYTLRGWSDGYWGSWYVGQDPSKMLGGMLAKNTITITEVKQ